MGKPGPARLSTEVLIKRGSKKARERLKEAKKKLKVNSKARPRKSLPKISITKKLLKSLPDYNPFLNAKKYEFKRHKALKAIRFFHEKLTHVKGEKAGQPFILEAWEQAIIANMFGWVHKKTGLRRYREVFIEVAKKNGKTPLCAGIILYTLFEDGEPGAEIYGAASEYKQASLVFTHAWGMRNKCTELRKRSHVFKGQSKAIEVGEPGDDDYGIYRVISSDTGASHGFNAHLVVVDEIHTLPNSELLESLESSIGARLQPLIVYITTSDYEREGSICNELEDYAKGICDGMIIDATFLPVLFQAELTDDWTKKETWMKANPNLGISVTLEYLKRACKKAMERPSYENTFKRLHLNIRTQQDVRWIKLPVWDACLGEYNIDDLIGRKCFAGLDLSSNQDITAFVMLFPMDDGTYIIVPRFWIPKDNAHDRERNDKVPYTIWGSQGFITLTPGDVIDYEILLADVATECEKYDVTEIAYDRFGFEALRQRMINLGHDSEKLISFGQGFLSLSPPSKEFETLLLAKKLIHDGNPVMRWMAQNVTASMDAADNIKPDKKKSKEKIDGIVALIMAIGRNMVDAGEGISVYDERGVIKI